MLYALDLPSFVIDIYTKRMCAMFGIKFPKYIDYKKYFEDNLKDIAEKDKPELFREYHALIVASGQDKHMKLA